MIFEGIITQLLAKETITTWWWDREKRTFVLEEISDREYKASIAVDVRWEKVMILDQFPVWTAVKVSMNSRAREYNGKRYNSISAWKIEAVGWSDTPPPAMPPSEGPATPPNTTAKKKEVDDDLPF